MAIITINTIPISNFIINWIDAIGETGFQIIISCLLIFICCSGIQMVRADKKRKMERLKNKYKRYYD